MNKFYHTNSYHGALLSNTVVLCKGNCTSGHNNVLRTLAERAKDVLPVWHKTCQILCFAGAELAEHSNYFYFCTSSYPLAHKRVPRQPEQHWHASIWQHLSVCVCAHARSPAPTALPGTQTHFTSLSEVILLFFDRPTEERKPEEGKWARRGVSQANTKGYRTHSTLNIKDSGNCRTLLSGSCGTVGHLIHLTLWMRENGSPVTGNHLEQMLRCCTVVNYFTSTSS